MYYVVKRPHLINLLLLFFLSILFEEGIPRDVYCIYILYSSDVNRTQHLIHNSFLPYQSDLAKFPAC